MDGTYYLMYLILPIGLLVCMLFIVKFCCKLFCCIGEPDPFDIEHPNVPIYVIPISTDEVEYGSSDGGSVDMMGASAPPPYDSLDPPTYSEWKWTLPKEDPPAYAALEFTASSPEPWQGASSAPDDQHVFLNEL